MKYFQVFWSDGQGIPFRELKSEAAESVMEVLKVNKVSTSEVIDKFYIELMEQQDQLDIETSKWGTITFKVFISKTNLYVYVLNCRNLKPLDSNGSSDPYVRIELKPDHQFENSTCVAQESAVHNDTLYPLIDQKFQLDISKGADSDFGEGAVLLFTVIDKDRVTQSDIEGEALFSIYDIPSVEGMSNTPTGVDKAFSKLKQTELPLMLSCYKSSPSLKTIKHRALVDADLLAKRFTKRLCIK